MRALFILLIGTALLGGVSVQSHAADKQAKNRERCAGFGYREGTDAFADCVMKLSLKDEKEHPDRATLIRRYRELSMSRRGDDRFPVCSAAMMENELDISINKWVGPSCQMTPD